MPELVIPSDLMHMTGTGQNRPPVDSLQTWRSALVSAGISKKDAERWLPRQAPGITETFRIALTWHLAGFDYVEASTWIHLSRWAPEAAAEWRAAQFTAEEATFVSTIIRRDLVNAGRILTAPETDERRWLDTGLPPSWICLCVAAGIQNPATAADLYEQADTNPHLRGNLHMYGSVVRGADARTLTFETTLDEDNE